MITVNHQGEWGVVGLLGVDEGWRSRGIGRRLLRAAGFYCRTYGCKKLVFVTQSDNAPGCRLYESSGYKLAEEQCIFHFWRSKS